MSEMKYSYARISIVYLYCVENLADEIAFRSCGWKMDLCVSVISSVIKRLSPREHNADAKGCWEVIGEIASCKMDCVA